MVTTFFMVHTLAIGADLGPAKLPDARASLATNSLHKSGCIVPFRPAIAEQSNVQVSRVLRVSRVLNCFAAAMLLQLENS